MARTKANEESTSSIFRGIFEANPELLRVSSFVDVARLYEASGPGRKFTDRERGLAANIKSRLRKVHGIKGRRRARKAQLATASQGALRVGRSATSLLKLEDMVDECLMAAKRSDSEALGPVIKLLRAARNKIIHMQGDL
ncbi:MAG: hypothetical protein U0746_01835 [Gemmataceae bacterium]